MRLKELGGAPEGRQPSAGVPPPNRRDMKLSCGLSVQVYFIQAGGSDSWWLLEGDQRGRLRDVKVSPTDHPPPMTRRNVPSAVGGSDQNKPFLLIEEKLIRCPTNERGAQRVGLTAGASLCRRNSKGISNKEGGEGGCVFEQIQKEQSGIIRFPAA